MTAVTFDTHFYIKRLRDKNVPEAVVLSATKADLRELELRLKLHIGSMIMALGGVLIAIKYLG